MLAVTRSDSRDTVHFYKSKVFADAANFFNTRGITYGEQGRYLLAINDFNRAVRLKPDYVAAYNNRGATYLLHGDNQLGCKDAQKACDWGICTALIMAKNNGLCR
jgi:tetratricopeptide (TPR) repeat protein